jgi:outer membrane protein OmpA-like peptidoglycan-associated protein
VTLAVLVNKTESTGADSVAVLAAEAYQQEPFGNLGEHFSAEGVPAGAPNLIRSLFGDRFGAIANSVASYNTGARRSSITALFGSVVPYALALLGRRIREGNLQPAAVSSLLTGQKASIWAAVPRGVNLPRLLGAQVHPSPSHVTGSAMPTGRGTPLLLPVLLFLIAGGVAWYWLRSRAPVAEASAGLDSAMRPAATDSILAPQSAAVDSVRAAATRVTLPNGVGLKARPGGMEERLIAFLRDSTAPPDENLWFDFESLRFEAGTARIVPGSGKEVTNLAQILRAFPNARIQVGAFTDSAGSETTNLKVSKERAEAVAKELQQAGLSGQIAGVEGYGSAFAKLPASAPEAERIKDRRVSVSVRAK